ncbi:MAG: response regulator, partial [Microcoleus sp. SIO2G3]|nr:response regulator [Microcoleus sp. SIO2G3]
QIAQYCQQLNADSEHKFSQTQYWDQDALAELERQKKITHTQLVSVFEGNLVEILFDVIQLSKQLRLGPQIVHRPLSEKFLPPKTVCVQADRVCHQVEQVWRVWQQAGLSALSPNCAPVIWDAKELQRQISWVAYQNLTALADGDRTLRDIAVELKQPIAPLTQSILPYVQTGMMGLIPVNDLSYAQPKSVRRSQFASNANSSRSVEVRSPSALIAYIEDSRFDSVRMSQILVQAGYRFINVQEPIQALPTLLEHKPNLIFLDLLMPVTNGYEVCSQIRRISAFKDTPVIIVTSNDGIVDRVRAKLVGSSGFITKPIEPQKVLSILRSHLAKN